MKPLTVSAVAAAAAYNITKEDILIIISIIVTVLNIIAEYIRKRNQDDLKEFVKNYKIVKVERKDGEEEEVSS